MQRMNDGSYNIACTTTVYIIMMHFFVMCESYTLSIFITVVYATAAASYNPVLCSKSSVNATAAASCNSKSSVRLAADLTSQQLQTSLCVSLVVKQLT